MRVTVVVVRDEDGAPPQVVGFLEDITAIRTALDRVEDQQAQLALTLEASGTATWDLDLGTGTYTVSDNLYEVCGIDAMDTALTFPEFIERVHPDDLPRFLSPADSEAEQEDQFLIDFRLRDDRGHHQWYRSRGRVTFSDGLAVRIRGAIVDITPLLESDRQEKRQAQLYRRTIDAASDAFVAADAGGRIVDGTSRPSPCSGGRRRRSRTRPTSTGCSHRARTLLGSPASEDESR